jgi:hypothetical protein
MEIKYTLEILTKDIQEIEKLVGNLQNSPRGSMLELDLALSKLRNVYDILTVIRSDMAAANEQQKVEVVPPPEEIPMVEKVPEPEQVPEPEEVPLAEQVPAPEEISKPKEVSAPEEDPIKKKARTPENAETLAEKFMGESSINENLAGNQSNVDSKLMGKPIESIGRNIGINDRFLIIRELFDGDTESFGKLIGELDKAGDFSVANQLLEQIFENTPDHEGVLILANLVIRRYKRV